MKKLAEVWAWLKKWGLAIAGVLAAILGAGIVWDASKRRTARLADELAVEKARRKVAALDAQRAALDARDEAHVEEIKRIETERQVIARETVALDRDVAAMSDEEVERAFRDLF